MPLPSALHVSSIVVILCALLTPHALAHQPTPQPDSPRQAGEIDDLHALVATVPPEYRHLLIQRLSMADENRVELVRALRDAGKDETPEHAAEEREAMAFLIVNMPEPDLKALNAAFLLRAVDGACETRRTNKLCAAVPTEIFLDAVLPYSNLDETRDDWRTDFAARFAPLVKDSPSLADSAQRLNRNIFEILKVSYHATKRKKPHQSPRESMDIGFASCTGLSIILVDACRAVGVPARVVGTPLWADKSGNHTWVEIWDGEWMYLAAAEPGDFNKSWFSAMAAKADPSKPEHRIYAASFQRTDTPFILPWAEDRTDISAVDVSADYIARRQLRLHSTDPSQTFSLFHIYRGDRLIAQRPGPEATFDLGVGRDGTRYSILATLNNTTAAQTYQVLLTPGAEPYSFDLKAPAPTNTASQSPATTPGDWPTNIPSSPNTLTPTDTASLAALQTWLERPRADRESIDKQPFAATPLTAAAAQQAAQLLWDDHAAAIRADRAAEWNEKSISIGEGDARKTMLFLSKTFGTKPAAGWDLYISMHGGGNAPPNVNDQQWHNQIKLYSPPNSLVIAPRAPTNTWNLWHEPHIDTLFDRLIEDAIILGEVNPDRIYLMGYSAGGDGVYQLAPRMADRFAAASMMAGHPNDASPLGLRNIGFALHMGANDDGYNRNKVAREWETKLNDLRAADPTGYPHHVELHDGRGHWMNGEDAKALPWMAAFTRDTAPLRIVWKQSGVTHPSFYWLAVPAAEAKPGALIIATRSPRPDPAAIRVAPRTSTVTLSPDQHIDIEKAENVSRLTIRLNDRIFDLDAPISITMAGKELYRASAAQRTIATIARTLAERGDPRSIYSAEITVDLPAQNP